MAGGIDPDPKTLAELWRMARGAWNATASLMATFAEPYRDADMHPQPYSAIEFHPFRATEEGDGQCSDVLPYDPAVLQAVAAFGKEK